MSVKTTMKQVLITLGSWGIGVAVACTLLATLKLLAARDTANPVLRVLTHERWLVTLVLLVPMLVGDYGRGDISPAPWTAFVDGARRNGLLDGLVRGAVVLIVDIWLLWLFADVYIRNASSLDRRARVLARLFNFAVGLLLMTPWNPIYYLLSRITFHRADD